MIQTFLQLPVVTLTRVMLGVALAFVIMPAIALPRPLSARTSLDAAVVRSVRWIGIVLAVSHLLVLVRLFHVAPILLLWLWLWKWTADRTDQGRQRRARIEGEFHGRVSAVQRVWLGFVDLMYLFERSGRAMFGGWARSGRSWLSGLVGRVFNLRSLRVGTLIAPVVGILGASLWLRVEQSFRFETLSPPEAYVFLTWAKSFAVNDLFVDGIYPHGLPAFIAFLGKLTPGIDLYEVVRYTGAVIGMMLVFGVFYASLRLTANVGAALFASGAFGLFGTVAEWHAPWVRQTGPMPQELGFAIALFALPSAVLAVTERDPDHVRTTLLAAVGIGLVHPVALVVFLVLAVAGAVGSALFSRGGGRFVAGVLVSGVVGGLVAHVYLPIALLAGRSRFYGLDHPFAVVDVGGSRTDQIVGLLGLPDAGALGHNALSLLAGVGAVGALVAAAVLYHRARTHHIGAQLAGLSCMALTAVAAYDVTWIPLPSNLLGPAGILAGIGLSLGLAAGFAAVTSVGFAIRRPAVRTAAGITLCAVALTAFGLSFESGPRVREPSEYPQMAAVTRDIMRNQDAFTYTIVGTPQQRQAVTGIGTFIELWVFARDVTVRDAQDPGFVIPDLASLMFARDLGQQLPIPTTDIYIFVEKVPFPVPELDPVGPTEEYYYDRARRGRIMATTYGWAEFYRHYHTDMRVHHEDDEIIVYQIRRRPNPVAALASPQFKDYSWEPGTLFTGGPADPSEVVIPWRD